MHIGIRKLSLRSFSFNKQVQVAFVNRLQPDHLICKVACKSTNIQTQKLCCKTIVKRKSQVLGDINETNVPRVKLVKKITIAGIKETDQAPLFFNDFSRSFNILFNLLNPMYMSF